MVRAMSETDPDIAALSFEDALRALETAEIADLIEDYRRAWAHFERLKSEEAA